MKNYLNQKHFNFFLRTPSGFSLLEILIASAIMMVNLGVISTAVIQYGEVSKKQKVISFAMDLESALHRAVADPGTYDDVNIDELVFNSNFHASFELAPEVGGNTLTITAFPYDQYLTADLQSCAGFTADNCLVRLEVVRNVIDAGNRVFAFGYRIRINPNLQIQVGNLGKEDNGAFVSPNEYLLYVPQFLLMSSTAARTECDLTNTAGLTGYNKFTGESVCLRQPAVGDGCGPDKLARGLTVQQIPFTLQFRCVDPPSYSCLDPNATALGGSNLDYSLQRFNPASFDPDFVSTVGYTGSPNRCVFTSENPTSTSNVVNNKSSVQTTNGPCPPRYNNTSTTCVYNNVVIVNGSCRPCLVPDGYGGCTTYDAPIVYPGAGYSTASGTNPASCTITIPGPPASCLPPGTVDSSPTVRADITIQPNCSLTVSEFNPI